MEIKTQLPEMTPAPLRIGGVVMIIATAAVPPLAWTLASAQVSLAGLLVAGSAWAVIALVGYFAMGRTADSKTFAVLVCGCAAVWTVVLSIGFWFLVRREFGVDSPVTLGGGAMAPDEVMKLFGVAAAATGATYGFFSAVRYRDLPRTFPRTLRAAAWAAVPSVALSLAVYSFNIANRYAAFAILAPVVLALAVTAVTMAVPRPATTPAGIS
jgi:hypothetical protein